MVKKRLAKINYGPYITVTEFEDPEELESTFIQFSGLLVTVVKDQGELVVTSAVNDSGEEIIDSLNPYSLNIEYYDRK